MPAYDAFATAAVNVAFPTWFYSAWAIAGLHPLVKAQLSPDQRAAGADPDCRPVAVGECTLRSIARQLTDEASPVAAEELRPQQVAVGVSGGLSIMIHGVRLLLEQHGDFVVVRLDMRNGYNAASRSVLLRRPDVRVGVRPRAMPRCRLKAYPGRALGPLGGRYCGLCRM